MISLWNKIKLIFFPNFSAAYFIKLCLSYSPTNAVYEKVGFVFQGHLNPKWKFVIKNYKQ